MIHAMIFNEHSEEILNNIFMDKAHLYAHYTTLPNAEFYEVCPSCEKCSPIKKQQKILKYVSSFFISSGVILMLISVYIHFFK